MRLKFVPSLPDKDPVKSITLSLVPMCPDSEGASTEYVLYASDGVLRNSILGIRSDGTIVRYRGATHAERLKALGFQTSDNQIKLFGEE